MYPANVVSLQLANNPQNLMMNLMTILMMMMATWQILNHTKNMWELMMKACTYLLLRHMWMVVMWVRKVSLNLNLMRNMRGWTNWKRFCATYAYCSI